MTAATNQIGVAAAGRPAKRLGKRLALIGLAVAVGGLLAHGIYTGFRTSADIQFSTGDIRYRYLGIPVRHWRMPDPDRSLIQSAALESTVLSGDWQPCATFPLSIRDDSDIRCRASYARATAWLEQDPGLGRLVLEDLAAYIRKNKGDYPSPPPDCAPLLSMARFQVDRYVVADDWRENPAVILYAEAKGYELPLAPDESEHCMVLLYDDFGPHATARRVVGQPWYQWESHGDEIRQDDVRIVVYKDIDLGTVSQLYPVSKEKGRDFRYLEYGLALSYLDQTIAEFARMNANRATVGRFSGTIAALKAVKQRILEHFRERPAETPPPEP
jgi:hypothetical protein